MKILYYDSSEPGRALIRQALEQDRGRSQITEANSPADIERMLSADSFDVVVIDFNPDEARGSDYFEALGKKQPLVPIVLLVEPGREESALEAVQQGATDYIVKTPARIQRLPFSIRIALERARLMIERQKAKDELMQLTQDLENRVADRTAQLAAANQELEAFSYSVSHDLRAPLRAIEGFARILVEDHFDKLAPEGQRCVNIIIASTERMNQLIEDLLAFSRLTRAALEQRPINMTEMAKSVIAELRRSEPHRKVQVTIAPLLPLKADSAMLRQVFINLLSNALKFTQHQTNPVIEIGSYRDGAEHVYFVKDNGVGFDMQYADKLFNVFQRLHRTDQFEGTGVGLAIVKRIILRHGGHTWAEGKVDRGATFYFSMPAGVPIEDEVAASPPRNRSAVAEPASRT